ncbi:dTDP-4-dehydrorhamnose 3,5-epimerase [Kineococcus xinjiangensis]|uniref:dTDP-4-dehydrorhamnose 3,5-epimerase n=1 Tax=Kineococcus xinjiangensis TaxID=512762 RepID=A0A2S6II60_9ACTN|nr:dTDP-4-dehydrorhamnose 3,5-epimerase [Kineococcus xinjiangensis]PPK93878.1 dTDP-4-dehydrorhamnose 3,5-epimerase [Kineococcus xinjiangensis]
MDVEELGIEGAWVFRPRLHADERGTFVEQYTALSLAGVAGHPLHVAQVNASVSAAGVVRGVHFADVPPGQAKYVTCTSGAILDVVVDLREGSATFGAWRAVLLDDVDRAAVYLSEGLGHAFCSLDDDSTVVYLCSSGYAPSREHGIHPLDTDLGIDWPAADRHGHPLTLRMSPKDATAPSLAQARAQELLPDAAECARWRRELVGHG